MGAGLNWEANHLLATNFRAARRVCNSFSLSRFDYLKLLPWQNINFLVLRILTMTITTVKIGSQIGLSECIPGFNQCSEDYSRRDDFFCPSRV